MCSRKWLIVALVACGLASACSQYNTNLSIQTSSSSLTFVSPSAATAGTQGFTITANGGGFVSGALILWNGTALQTTLVSSIQLTAPVPATLLAMPGTVQVAVQIPGSAQNATTVNNTTTTEISNIVLFTISSAPGTPPAIASLSPTSMPYCGNVNGFPLLVNAASGTTFTSDATVIWNGSPRHTTPMSSTQLSAAILPMDTATNTSAAVTVSNSGGQSNALQFTISSPTANLPAPALGSGSLSPTSALAGSAATILAITSSSNTSFLPCSVVQWVSGGGVTTSLPTTYVPLVPVSPTNSVPLPPQLLATVPSSDLLTPGTATVKVFTPGPGGGTSQTLPFTITQPPAPTITSLAAMLPGATTTSSTVPNCSPQSFTLIVNGTNFVNGGSVINWNGSPLPTTYVPATTTTAAYLTALVPYSDAVVQGSFPVTVSNGSALSNSISFSVTAPTTNFPGPTATSISPANTTAGSAQFLLTVTGTNFLPCSVIQWNGTPRATTYIGPTQISTTILPADLSTVGTANVTVFNPAPGGGTSTPSLPFSILGMSIASLSASTTQMPSTPYCSPVGFTLTVNAKLPVAATATTPAMPGTTFTSDTVVDWNGSPRPTTFVNGTQLTAAITYADIASMGTVNVTVSNSATSSTALPFTITAPTSFPTPSISSLAPNSTAAGGGAFVLSVVGNNLLPCSVVQWNGSARTTTFVSTNGLTASISAADIAAVQNIPVTVNTPPPSPCTVGPTNTCGTSNAEIFDVFTPVASSVRGHATAQSASSVSGESERLLSLALMSSDHRYAVRVLASTDGVTEVAGAPQNIFVLDTCQGAPSGCIPSNTLVSVGLDTNPADGNSISPSIGSNGRYVAFLSSAMNLVDSDTNGVTDAFIRDTCAGAPSGCTPFTQRVSVATDGTQANGATTSATIDATGRFITFESSATNLASSSSSSSSPSKFYLRDTCIGAPAGCVPSTSPLD